jgi:hypothetical protein
VSEAWEQEQFEAVLKRLAEMTPKAIASWLVESEAFGYRGSTCECPLATFLAGAAGGYEVSITEDEDEPMIASVWAGGRLVYELPETVVYFVRRFDDGEFPQLDLDLLEETS